MDIICNERLLVRFCVWGIDKDLYPSRHLLRHQWPQQLFRLPINIQQSETTFVSQNFIKNPSIVHRGRSNPTVHVSSTKAFSSRPGFRALRKTPMDEMNRGPSVLGHTSIRRLNSPWYLWLLSKEAILSSIFVFGAAATVASRSFAEAWNARDWNICPWPHYVYGYSIAIAR